MGPLAVGTQIQQRYRVDAVFETAPTFTTYRATDVSAPRPVHLKVLRPGPDAEYSQAILVRYQREVQIVAGLRSQHQTKLYDYGEWEGLLFLVFEPVDGPTLGQCAPVTEAEGVGFMRDLLQALHESHTAGLLHRDVRPANIRVVELRGRRHGKLLNYGLGRQLDAHSPRITATGELLGEPRYLPPEQLRGEPASPATDIFGLGVSIYEAIVATPATSPLTPTPKISPGLLTVLARMADVDPGRRFHAAAAVLRALDDIHNASQMAKMPTDHASAPSGSQYNTAKLMGLLVAVAAIIGVSVAIGRATAPDPVIVVVPSPKPPTPIPSPAAPTIPYDVSGADLGIVDVVDEAPFTGRGYLIDDITNDRWLTYIPTSYDPTQTYPLVMLLHQQGHHDTDLFDATEITAVAEREGFVVIAPDDPGIAYAWEPAGNHYARIKRIVEATAEQLTVNPQRVLVIGHGSGGALAWDLACRDWVAAVATHAVPWTRGEDRCVARAPRPMLMYYPMYSRYEPYDGGTSCSGKNRHSAEELTEMFRKRNGCGVATTVTLEQNKNVCRRYDRCDVPFEACDVAGGHGWPGTKKRGFPYERNGCDGPDPEISLRLMEHAWSFFDDTVVDAP